MKRHDTKAEAKSWAAQMEVELGKMINGVNDTHTFNDVFCAMHMKFLKQKERTMGNCAPKNVCSICNC